MFFIFHLAF
ncbi:hypothetical protein D046_6318A, partial [Vibrio parahaemolyticus V-223/04]